MPKTRNRRVLLALSLAAAPPLQYSSARGATLSLYYGQDANYANSNNSVLIAGGYDPNATATNAVGGTEYFTGAAIQTVSQTSPTTITVPVGGYLSLAFDAVLTGATNADGGKRTGPSNDSAVQPSFLGLSSLSMFVTSTDSGAQFLTPLAANTTQIGTFNNQPTYTSTIQLNASRQGTNDGGGYNAAPKWNIFNIPGDVQPQVNGNVGLNGFIEGGNFSATSDSAGLPLLEQFAAQSNAASYNNSTEFLDSLIYQGLAAGSVTLQPSVQANASQYWVLKTPGSSTTSSAYGVHTFTSSDTINQLPTLVINIASPPANLTWNDASANNTWDTNFSSNWNNGSSTTVFHALDNVTFNDTNGAVPGRYAVTLSTTVTPGSVTINNSSASYTISGTGSIAGTGSLTKSGTGTLTLYTANSYTGGTNVSAGTLVIAQTTATTSPLPKGALTISGAGKVQLATNATLGSQSTLAPASNINLTSLSITGTGQLDINVGSSRVDLQACKLEYSIVSPK